MAILTGFLDGPSNPQISLDILVEEFSERNLLKQSSNYLRTFPTEWRSCNPPAGRYTYTYTYTFRVRVANLKPLLRRQKRLKKSQNYASSTRQIGDKKVCNLATKSVRRRDKKIWNFATKSLLRSWKSCYYTTYKSCNCEYRNFLGVAGWQLMDLLVVTRRCPKGGPTFDRSQHQKDWGTGFAIFTCRISFKNLKILHFLSRLKTRKFYTLYRLWKVENFPLFIAFKNSKNGVAKSGRSFTPWPFEMRSRIQSETLPFPKLN